MNVRVQDAQERPYRVQGNGRDGDGVHKPEPERGSVAAAVAAPEAPASVPGGAPAPSAPAGPPGTAPVAPGAER